MLAGGLALSWLLERHLRDDEGAQEREEFELRVIEIASGLQRRLQEYSLILQGVKGLLVSSGEVTRDVFHRYVEALRLPESFPGILGVGYAILVDRAEKGLLVTAMRAQGLPDYDIHQPPGDRNAYAVVIYVEPLEWPNQRALGFHFLTESVRAAAAARVRDENRVALSERVTLKQETDPHAQAGFLAFLPDYRPGLPLDTPAQRRLALRGWVYAAFRVKDMVDAYLRTEYPELSQRLAIEIYAGEPHGPDTLLYALNQESVLAPEVLAGEHWVTFGGQDWNIRLSALPAYLLGESYGEYSRTVLVAGVLLSLALAWIVWVMVRAHLRVTAVLIATDRSNQALAERTRELAESEGRVRLKLEALLSPAGDLETLDLADIIDCRELQRVMENFFRLTNLAVALLDLKGKVLVATGWQEICTSYHRVHPESARNCLESDTILSQGLEPGTFRTYRCKNGMLDVVTPIMIGGKHLGNLFLGQFFFDKDDSLLRIIPDAVREQRTMANWVNQLPGQRLLVLQDTGNLAYTGPAFEVFSAELAALGPWRIEHRPLRVAEFKPDDYQALMAEPYDALYILAGSFQTAVGNIAQLFHYLHPEAPILLTPWARSPAILETSGDAIDRITLASVYPSRHQDAKIEDYFRRFHARFGYDPHAMTIGVRQALELLDEAFAQGYDTPEEVKQYLLSVPVHQTSLGPIAFDGSGDVEGHLFFLTDLQQELQ